MMTQQNHRRPLLAFLLYVAALLSFPSPARAEDTDIFFINSVVATTRPNVLILLDNTSNWDSTDTVAGDGTSRFQNVRQALKDTVLGLDDRFNVGLMLFSETGAGNSNPDGAVVRAGVRQLTLDAADGTPGFRTKFANLVGNLNGFDKGNNAKVGLAFYEAYQYYANSTAYSGANKAKRDYAGNSMPTGGNNANDNPQLVYSNAVWATAGNALADSVATRYVSPIADNCQKNFIIFISNGTTLENSSDINTATNFLAAQGGDTTVVGLTPSGLQNNVSDEWAKFMATTDPVNFPGKPTIVTYAVEVNPVPSGGNGPEWTAVMKSIGNLGKGKYFGVSSANAGAEIKAALDQIFAEVLAVNSVFASATLPVSVNVRGTFLNQVYMGVFRPDANASPRWTGNVKQYQLKPTGTSGALVLVDTAGVPIENAATGFVRPSAISYWTKNESPGFWNLNYYPDVKAQAPLTATASDSPDGEFVEKGGAAQHLRITYASDVSTRKLYTCLTGFCSTDDTLSAGGTDNFRFHTANANITDAMLGVTPAVALESLTRSGTTATATLTNHGFTSGQVVAIKNAADGAYNGIYAITKLNANQFTYPITESPVELATGTITASKGGTPIVILSMSRSTANDATSNTSMVTVNTAVPHGFNNGSVIQVSGAVPAEYNGNWTIATLGPLTSAFTFNLTTTPATPATLSGATATGTVITKVKGVDTPVTTVRDIDSVTRVGTTVTVTTTANHGFDAGYSVTIGGAGSPYDGSKSPITVTGNRTFTYTITTGNIGPSATVTTLGNAAAPSASLSGLSVSRVGTTATAVATSSPIAAGFANGDLVTITGADQPEYNGSSIAISSVTASGSGGSFKYTVTVSPPNSTTGATVEGGGVDRATLINWMRGENRRLDDNPVNDAAAVRGYLHGDVLHSRPAVVNYNRSSAPVADRDIVVYYGANDGIIHAVKGGDSVDDGYELWGFVPEDFFGRFARLYTATPKIVPGSSPRNYFGDGPISVDAHYVRDGSGVERIEGTDADGNPAKVQLYIGMRRGGRFYYSLDVTDPLAPVYKWKISNTTPGFDELGQSWSDPKVVTIKVKYPDPSAAATERKVLVFGAGYDPAALDSVTPGTATMGRGIFVVDAATGGLIWFAGPASPASVPAGATYKSVPGMTSAIPADVAIINSDFDVRNLMDRIYAADTGGNIWRVNIGDVDPANWTVGHVAALSGVGAENQRRFLFAPDIVPFDGSWDSILVGSGDREQPFDTTIANRFYMIKDPHALTALPATAATETDLCDLTTSSVLVQADKDCLATSRGWMIRLGAGEKVVTGATTLASTTIFATNTPASVVAPGQCTGSLGLALIYAVDFRDATPDIFGVVGGVATARASVRPGGGFPPTPVPVSVQIDGKTYEGAITGTQVINPPLSVIGQRYRVFWNLSIDN